MQKWRSLAQTEKGSRLIFILLMIFTEAFFLLFFTVVNAFEGDWIMVGLTSTGGAFLILTGLVGRKWLPQDGLAIVLVLFLWIICFYFALRPDNKLLINWSIVFPLASIFMLGWKRSLPFTITLLGGLLYVVFIHHPEMAQTGAASRVIGPYILVNFVCSVFEAMKANNITILQKTLKNLHNTQEALIENEKLAALGSLVTGVAHEVNTPLGNSITIASLTKQLNTTLARHYVQGTLTQPEFDEWAKKISEAEEILETNLNRTAALIQSFKQLSVDEMEEEPRSFEPAPYITALVEAQKSLLEEEDIRVSLSLPPDLRVNSIPGLWARILTGLLQNSIVHGFPPSWQGEKRVSLTLTGGQEGVTWDFRNNGKAIEESIISRIFDPFFTTARGRGGSGLGLSIIHSIVTRRLRGTLSVRNGEGGGVQFLIHLPWNLSSDDSGPRESSDQPASAP